MLTQSSIGDAEHGIALSDADDDDAVSGKATNKGRSANDTRSQLKCLHLNFNICSNQTLLMHRSHPKSSLFMSLHPCRNYQSKAPMCASICADKVHQVLNRGT
jgi:hypothetical protein